MRPWVLCIGPIVIVVASNACADEPNQEELTQQRKKLQTHADQLFAEAAKLFGAGKPAEALRVQQQELKLRRKMFGKQDHSLVARSLNAVGFMHLTMGRHEEALPFYKDSLAMLQRLYKNQDHPHLAISLNSMAFLLQAMGQYAEALPFYQDALAMQKRGYKDRDHPQLSTTLNNIGLLLVSMGRYEKALPYYKSALAMRQRLFEDQDHPYMAQSLNNLGGLLDLMGRTEEALVHVKDAIAMRRRLYQDRDHPDLALSLAWMGFLLQTVGRYEESLPFYKEALAIQSRIGSRFTLTSGLAEALAHARTLWDSRSGLYAASEPVVEGRGSVYESTWTTKAAMARLFRARRALARAQKPKELSNHLAELAEVQRRISGVLARSAPKDGDPRRDRVLAELTDQQRQVEQQISELLPVDLRPVEPDLTDLIGALQTGEVFIDFYRYFDRAAPKGQRAHHYIAFVIDSKGKPQRVNLNQADPIDEAVRGWLKALGDWRPDVSPIEREDIEQQAEIHAASLRRLLWAPIAKRLPADAKRLFISADGDLGRVPFAALPGDLPDRVLLDQYSIATVESGPFLLERLTAQGDRNTSETLLAVGGVRYDPPEASANGPWTYLDGTQGELRQVVDLWGDRGNRYLSSGHDASTGWLMKQLPKANYAHLATHGQFRAQEFAEEQRRFEQFHQDRIAGVVAMRSGNRRPETAAAEKGLGVRNPLGYVGLVMAGANDPPQDSPDRGILAGTTISPLDLSRMKLAVLSACETGLGEYTRDAGVQNLILAFHVAGCDNVIASLWKVNDEATAALMGKFYHELWVNKKPIIEALREAQLMVYRRPDLIPDLAGSRGAIRVRKALTQKPNAKAGKRDGWPSRTPPKYWAAFVLSGAGK